MDLALLEGAWEKQLAAVLEIPRPIGSGLRPAPLMGQQGMANSQHFIL